MRDPDRIDQVLAELKRYWKAHPDLRLGQIVGNATLDSGVDPYYMEDEDFLVGLRKIIKVAEEWKGWSAER